MDTETVSPNFDDIRPLNNSEVKDAIEKLVANEDFERALRYIKPNLNWEEFSVAMRACKTKDERCDLRKSNFFICISVLSNGSF